MKRMELATFMDAVRHYGGEEAAIRLDEFSFEGVELSNILLYVCAKTESVELMCPKEAGGSFCMIYKNDQWHQSRVFTMGFGYSYKSFEQSLGLEPVDLIEQSWPTPIK